jgi:probable rRNA maturation factor
MPPKSKVFFFYEKQGFVLQNRGQLKQFIASIFRREKTALDSLNYIFCSDKRLAEINRQFLHRSYYTDIISFDLADDGPVQGEIYISIDRVRENSKQLGLSFKSEIHRVIFHGALHLCGYDDKTLKLKTQMSQKEDQYLEDYLG